MSWFGETFGDSLSSLKGQITKITKEVLVDDEASSSTNQEAENELVKQLQALNESKDMEIAALKDKLLKLHKKYESPTEILKGNVATDSQKHCDNYDLQIKELKNELIELKKERDHLNCCLEELLAEHQINLDEVISVRDKYKSELESVRKNYNYVQTKLDDVLSSGNTKEVSQNRGDEIIQLNSQINDLQKLLEKEKETSFFAIKKEVTNQDLLKKQLEQLKEDIKVLSKGNKQLEDKGKILESENEQLNIKLSQREKENNENKIKLKLLLNEKDELVKKCQNQADDKIKLSDLIKTEVEVKKKLNTLLQLLQVDAKEILNGNDFTEIFNLFESKFLEKCKELNENSKELSLKNEVVRLNDENKNMQNKLKISVENCAEIERKYQEEISSLKNSLSEIKAQEQDCINQSQADDVKRLEQEIVQCQNIIFAKNSEIADYAKALNSLEEELKNLKTSSLQSKEELITIKEERKKLEDEIFNLKKLNEQLTQEKVEVEKKVAELMFGQKKIDALQSELEKAVTCKSEAEKKLGDLENELENLKAEIIIKESNLMELMKANTFFQEEMNKLQAENNKMLNLEKELEKWKDASVDLQILQEDLNARKDELEKECVKLKTKLETELSAKDAEIQELKVKNTNLVKSCSMLQHQVEKEAQGQSSPIKEFESEEECQKQKELISQLQEENSELKSRIQKFQEQMKMQMLESQPVYRDDVQQHRRSKSAIDTEVLDLQKSGICNTEDIMFLKQTLQQEQAKYQILQHHFQEISNKEANARKEFERLRQHLIEVEDHYTEEAVENEKIINDLKSKLVTAEEQLQNSLTLYTSLKVRDNQHLESLQSQIKMLSLQRDDLQTKLSAAEDEVQKHKASLMSLQIVLEQFQQDKEREIEEVCLKYERQLQSSNDRYRDLELEIQGLKNQLAEAKNGLKAASRLGEQLEKKTIEMSQLEENLRVINGKVAELENSLAVTNQSNNGKIDKSLIKNLVVGYVLSPNDDRKSQVLRIMASVLEFNQDERNKMGVDANRSGWLSNILHPKGEGPPNSQSLSEAFIRFLENESRPQPQLKFIPEQLEASSSKTSRTSPRPSGRFSELMLPTFNSSQENESSIILKNVLKDS